jgi:hypothetical protein
MIPLQPRKCTASTYNALPAELTGLACVSTQCHVTAIIWYKYIAIEKCKMPKPIMELQERDASAIDMHQHAWIRRRPGRRERAHPRAAALLLLHGRAARSAATSTSTASRA